MKLIRECNKRGNYIFFVTLSTRLAGANNNTIQPHKTHSPFHGPLRPTLRLSGRCHYFPPIPFSFSLSSFLSHNKIYTTFLLLLLLFSTFFPCQFRRFSLCLLHYRHQIRFSLQNLAVSGWTRLRSSSLRAWVPFDYWGD